MLERAEPILKALTAVFALMLAWQVAGAARGSNPLKRTDVPLPAAWEPAKPTNAAPATPSPGGMPPGMMGFPGRGGPGGPGGGVSPELQARIDRVVQSELLGMVMRPPPMALMGIIGSDVLLRGPNGMAGLVREGGELGGARVIRIGTNRVLVSVNGEEKELTIFEGIGGESLLSKPKQATP